MRATTAANLRRAVKVAGVVGPILTVINQTPAVLALLHGQAVSPPVAGRIALTFVVPFAVSWFSSTMADRSAGRG